MGNYLEEGIPTMLHGLLALEIKANCSEPQTGGMELNAGHLTGVEVVEVFYLVALKANACLRHPINCRNTEH